jgi:hypothetical protein
MLRGVGTIKSLGSTAQPSGPNCRRRCGPFAFQDAHADFPHRVGCRRLAQQPDLPAGAVVILAPAGALKLCELPIPPDWLERFQDRTYLQRT